MKLTFTCPHCKEQQTKNFYLLPNFVDDALGDIWINTKVNGHSMSIEEGSFNCPLCKKEIDFDKNYEQ